MANKTLNTKIVAKFLKALGSSNKRHDVIYQFFVCFTFCLNLFFVFIAESCGVHYTHANRHVVGPSEAENHMSKQALQDVFELKQFSQQPANCFPAWEVCAGNLTEFP